MDVPPAGDVCEVCNPEDLDNKNRPGDKIVIVKDRIRDMDVPVRTHFSSETTRAHDTASDPAY